MPTIIIRNASGNDESNRYEVSGSGSPAGWFIGGWNVENRAIRADELQPGDTFTQLPLAAEPFNLWIVARVENDPIYDLIVHTSNGGKLYLQPHEEVWYQGRVS